MKFFACVLLLFAAPAFAQEYDLSITVSNFYDSSTPTTTFSGIIAYQNGQLAVNVSDPTLWVTPFTIGQTGPSGEGFGNAAQYVDLVASQGGSNFLLLSFGLNAPLGSAGPLTIASNTVSIGNGWDGPAVCGGNPDYAPWSQQNPMQCLSATLTPVSAVPAPELSLNATAMTLLAGLLLVAGARKKS